MKYLVMEVHRSYVVVLDEEGAFRKAANFGYQVGDKVDYILEMNTPEQICKQEDVVNCDSCEAEEQKYDKEHKVISFSKMRLRKVFAGVSALAACCILIFTTLFNPSNQVYASVLMSINPQVNIDVNKEDIVVGLDGRNKDGEALIEGYKYKHKELTQVMDELIERAASMGYLKDGGMVTLKLDSEDDEWLSAKGDELRAYLKEHFDKASGIQSSVQSRLDDDYDDETDEQDDKDDGGDDESDEDDGRDEEDNDADEADKDSDKEESHESVSDDENDEDDEYDRNSDDDDKTDLNESDGDSDSEAQDNDSDSDESDNDSEDSSDSDGQER